MTIRRRKKMNRLRGHRTHGKGDTKHNRGAGSRGGRGKAGSHKHKFTLYQGTFGTEKKSIIGKEKGLSLNLDQIDAFLPKWISKGIATKENEKTIVDGRKAGFSKIIGKGKLNSKVVFENVMASKKALERIKQSGSEIKSLEEEAGVETNESG